MLILPCLLLLSGCNLGKNSSESFADASSFEEENKSVAEDTDTSENNNNDNSSDIQGEEPLGEENKSENDSTDNKEQTGEGEKPSKPSDKNPSVPAQPNIKPSSPSYSVVSDSSLSAQWDIIDSVVSAAQKYYTENFNKTRLITKDGYLYDYASKEKIDVTYLVAEGVLSSKYANKGCEILLLDADQMKNYDTLSIKSSESGLTVFAALKNPKDNTYLIASSKSAGGYLSASQYASLLNSYYQNHGSYGTLFSGSEEYNRIINFISMYESKYESYSVRSVIKDNKYSMVILSPANSTGNVKQYILKRNGNLWEVVMSGIEKEPRVPVAVNKKLPDFNLDMLPNCIINDYKNSLNSYNDEITALLRLMGYISDSSEIKYISSARGFGYVVLKNEIKYVAVENNGGWDLRQCASSGDAVKIMTSIKRSAPTFIVLDS